MNSLAKREKILIIIVAGLILMYVYVTFFLNPLNIKIGNEKQLLTKKTEEYSSIEKLVSSNKSNNKKLDTIKKKFDESVKALPKNEKNPEIAYNLNTLASKSSVVINSVTFGQIADSSGNKSATTNNNTNTITNTNNVNSSSEKLMYVPVNVIVSGAYPSIVNYINNIEKDTRISEIESVSISSNATDKSVLQCTLVLNYYFTAGNSKDQPDYDINSGDSGKDNLFN